MAQASLKETLSDIRKVGYQTFSVAHGDTNTARGGAKGTAKMRKQGELKIEILEKGLGPRFAERSRNILTSATSTHPLSQSKRAVQDWQKVASLPLAPATKHSPKPRRPHPSISRWHSCQISGRYANSTHPFPAW